MYPRHVLAVLRKLAPAVCAALLAACAESSTISPPNLATGAQGELLPGAYRLGVGDKVRIAVFGEQDLSGQFEVNALGAVPVPLVGEIPARGLSLPEFREQVRRRLSEGYIKSPKISVEIVSYRPIYVHGEVKNGGEFAFKHGTRLRDAIAMAGGYTYRAEQSYALITRGGELQEMRVRLPSDAQVLPGDNIRIPERFF